MERLLARRDDAPHPFFMEVGPLTVGLSPFRVVELDDEIAGRPPSTWPR
jgi:hypothetical protein